MMETPVLFNNTTAWLMLIESHKNIAKYRVAVGGSGIMDVVPARQFHVLVANFSEKSDHLLKNMLVSVGGGVPKCVVHI